MKNFVRWAGTLDGSRWLCESPSELQKKIRLDGPAFPFDYFQLGQPQQVVRIVDIPASALARELVLLAQEGLVADNYGTHKASQG